MRSAAARDTQPIAPIQVASCDWCERVALCQTVNDSAVRLCLPCRALPPAPRELPELAPPREVARGSRP